MKIVHVTHYPRGKLEVIVLEGLPLFKRKATYYKEVTGEWFRTEETDAENPDWYRKATKEESAELEKGLPCRKIHDHTNS